MLAKWVLIAVLGLVGCESPQQQYEILSVFFDGVPNPAEEEAKRQAEEEAKRQADLEAARLAGLTITEEGTIAKPEGSVHPPFAEKSCNDCHTGQGGENPRWKESPPFCFDCHDQDAVIPKNDVHPPVDEGECLVCHSPHKAPRPALIRRSQGELCTECHEPSEVRHSLLPELDGCTRCHDAHGNSNPAYLKKWSVEMCGFCHPEPADPTIASHEPAQQGACFDCHGTPHKGTPPYTNKPVPALCYDCHDEPTEEPAAPHRPFERGQCTGCHDAHGRGFEANLIHPGAQLCWTCHGSPSAAWSRRHVLVPGNAICWDCHQPHGGASGKLMPKNTAPICLRCHAEQIGMVAPKSIHSPVEEGACSDCHMGHDSGERFNLETQGRDLCLNCHDVGDLPTPPDEHGDDGFDCTDCHSPHASQYPKLLLEAP